jgi:hypothetical protein
MLHRIPKGFRILGAVVLALALIIVSDLASIHLHPKATPPTAAVVREGVIEDPPAQEVTLAVLLPSLVQWGSMGLLNYTGNGPPGLVVAAVSTPQSTLNWTLEAWANETAVSPPLPAVCALPQVRFSPDDWTFVASSNGTRGTGTFISIPSGAPARLLPHGDQCFLRGGVVETWHYWVCVNKDGVPKGGDDGLYRAQDGKLHHDTWDRCIGQDVNVTVIPPAAIPW